MNPIIQAAFLDEMEKLSFTPNLMLRAMKGASKIRNPTFRRAAQKTVDYSTRAFAGTRHVTPGMAESVEGLAGGLGGILKNNSTGTIRNIGRAAESLAPLKALG